jgi:hypothetical protein
MNGIIHMYGEAAIGGLVLFAGLAIYVFIKDKIEQAARARALYSKPPRQTPTPTGSPPA